MVGLENGFGVYVGKDVVVVCGVIECWGNFVG